METYWGLATDGVPASGIAAFYAYESQVPAVSVEKIEGLKSRYGIDDPRTLAFFTVHSTLDLEHSGAERDAIRAHDRRCGGRRRGRGRDLEGTRRVVGLPRRGERLTDPTVEPSTAGLPLAEFGFPRTDLRRRLVDAILRGEKTATTGSRSSTTSVRAYSPGLPGRATGGRSTPMTAQSQSSR